MKNNIQSFKLTQGFTLLEMMSVVGIIAILVTIAIPSYSSYNIRSKASEGLTAIAPVQQAFTEAFIATGSLSQAQAAANSVAAGSFSKYVSSISVNATGLITVTYNNANLGSGSTDQTITLQAEQYNSEAAAYVLVSNNSNLPSAVEWACSSTTSSYVTNSLNPPMIAPGTAGTLPSGYAPSICR